MVGVVWLSAPPFGYCLEASMTGCSCGFAVPSPLPLWIADQVRNDGVVVSSSSYSAWRAHAALWFPAYAGMTVRDAGNGGAGMSCSPVSPAALWILP